MVRILYIVSTLKRTGPTNVLFNLISELDRNKFDPIILTLSAEDSKFPSLVKNFEELGVRVLSLGLGRLAGFLHGKGDIKKIVKSNFIDIIHINGIRGDLLVKKNDYPNIKVISTINSNIYDDYTMLYGNLRGKFMAKSHIQSLDGKIAIGCSNFVVNELNKKYKAKLKTIYNGIPKDKYSVLSSGEKQEIRKTLGLDLDAKIFIFVGYLIYRKDPITAIKGFLESKSEIKSILLVLGDGPLMESCKLLVDKYPNKTVVFLGNQSETLKYLNASDYYISSAYSEGLPTSVMESMGCGLPVLLSKIEPHMELVSEIPKWKYLFNINDYFTLADEISEILSDDYEFLQAQCRKIIDEKINSLIMTKAYEGIYEEKSI